MRSSLLLRPSLRTLGRRSSSTLTTGNINQAVLTAEYAVRGELVLRAAAIKQEIAADPTSKPYSKLLECNIGNPQAVGQQPLGFNRQVLSLMVCPALLDLPGTAELFAPDAIARAKTWRCDLSGSPFLLQGALPFLQASRSLLRAWRSV